MLSIKTTPVHSEYRHSVTKNHIGFQPYVLKEHITSASYQNNHTHFNNYHKRPHLQIRLDENLTIQALVDTGSSICIGDSSLIQHLKNILMILTNQFIVLATQNHYQKRKRVKFSNQPQSASIMAIVFNIITTHYKHF